MLMSYENRETPDMYPVIRLFSLFFRYLPIGRIVGDIRPYSRIIITLMWSLHKLASHKNFGVYKFFKLYFLKRHANLIMKTVWGDQPKPQQSSKPIALIFVNQNAVSSGQEKTNIVSI